MNRGILNGKLWCSVPEVTEAYNNGKNFTGVSLKDIVFTPDNKISFLDLTGADFSGCDLTSTLFRYCNVSSAKFGKANLTGCSFIRCYFGEYVKYLEIDGLDSVRATIEEEWCLNECCLTLVSSIDNIRTALDTTGQDLIGYKALEVRICKGLSKIVIAKLLIPAEAKRIVFKDDKCRCEWAKVLEIYSAGTRQQYKSAYSYMYSKSLKYKVGEDVRADKFDTNARIVCSNGIHFFLTEEEAIEYGKRYL